MIQTRPEENQIWLTYWRRPPQLYPRKRVVCAVVAVADDDPNQDIRLNSNEDIILALADATDTTHGTESRRLGLVIYLIHPQNGLAVMTNR